jgi:hypothetical protein
MAQSPEARSATYLFSANVEDARALWVNPAGLGILPIASLYAEGTADYGAGDDWGIRQYSFGLHSRAIAVGYQRDRFLTGGSRGTWRIGAGLPLGRRAALGTAITLTKPQRSLDLGLRLSPVRLLDAGFVVRNVGRPDVNGVEIPMTLVGGLVWYLAGGKFALQGDATGTERRPQSGYDMGYRAGAQLTLPGRQAVTLLTAVDLGSSLGLNRWSFGIGIGYQAQALAVGSALAGNGVSARLQAVSVTGVARGATNRTRRS